jgi:histone H3/H4
MDRFVVLQTTMARILKAYSELNRIEKSATLMACEAADRWLHGIVATLMMLAEDEKKTTISEAMVVLVVGYSDTHPRDWMFCKTRLRDRIKTQSAGFRWSLGGKITLYNAFDDYLKLLASRIATTQELANRRTISERHVKAAVNFE